MGLSPGWDTEYYRNYRAAYAQDDWKVNSKLTVNLGVRYDFIQPDSSKAGRWPTSLSSRKARRPGHGHRRVIRFGEQPTMYCPLRFERLPAFDIASRSR